MFNWVTGAAEIGMWDVQQVGVASKNGHVRMSEKEEPTKWAMMVQVGWGIDSCIDAQSPTVVQCMHLISSHLMHEEVVAPIIYAETLKAFPASSNRKSYYSKVK